MARPIYLTNTIKNFNKRINVEGDKSLSIRWALMASIAEGKSRAYNLLRSEDILNTLSSLKSLGIKITSNNKYHEIIGNGLNGYSYKNNLKINAGNSGTLGRLILALLISYPKKLRLVGDKSLSRRDFSRVIIPLKKFGATFYPNNKTNLPLTIQGTKFTKPIKYLENLGSAQCKSSVMLAALNTKGTTYIKAKKSRDHTEILFKNLKIPIQIKKTKNYDYIKIKGKKNFKSFNYNIPADISSSAFFIVLTLLSKNSKLIIKNVNINPSRTGAIKILNQMGAKIIFINKRIYKGEKISDICVKSAKNLKAINCPTQFNSSAIDEFLVIFLCAARSKGISYFKNLKELNKKESRRLDWGAKILKMMGVKIKLIGDHGIKIWGQPNLLLKKNYEIKNYLKDHRVMAMCTVAALTLGGNWKIHDPDSINTSFPSFFNIIKKELGGQIKL